MKSKYKTLLKDTLIFGLGSFGSKIILFLMVPLYTNFMTDEEYGVADLVFTIAQFLIPFISVVIFDAIIRFGLSKHENKENTILVGFVILGFSAILGLILTPVIGIYQTISQWKWYLYTYVIFNIANSIELNYLKVKAKNKAYSVLCIIQTGLMASLNVYFLVYKSMGIQGYLLAYIISNLIIDIFAFIIGNIGSDLKKAKFDNRLFKEMVMFSTPLILNNISWWVIHSSDKVMVEAIISTSALGIYTVAAKIPSLINVLVTVFQQAWGISSIKEIENNNDTKYYSDVFNYFYLFTSGCCICLVSIMKIFIQFYVGDVFKSSWKYVPLLLVSAVFAAVASYYGSLYGALKKSLNNMITTVIAAITNIVLNFILIPHLGIWGAIIGTLGSYVVIAITRMCDVRKYIKISINVFKFTFNLLLILVQAIFVSLDWHVYTVSIITLIIFVMLNIKDFSRLIKNIKKKV